MIVPMFPLPGVFLYPGAVLPLHIFEARYRAMVLDLLDTQGRLVIATVRRADRPAMAGTPPVLEIGGLGEIVGHERLPDGRFLIALLGLERVRLREVSTPHPYRLVEIDRLEESEPDEDVRAALTAEILQALGKASGTVVPFDPETPISALTDILLAQSRGPEEMLLDAYGTMDLARRARIALDLSRRAPDEGEV